MDQVSNVFNGFTNLMDQNIRGVQLGCYSVALVGLTVAMRKVRPLSKFKNPSDIPNHFIKERRELTGLVKRIDPNGALLMIEHKPLINIPVIPSGQLPITITGVNVSGLGINWLQAVIVGSEIKFIPVLKKQDSVECEVLLLQQTKDKLRYVNLGENLVKIGFGFPATIKKPNDRKLLSYYNRLQSAELYAIKKNLGSKYYLTQLQKMLDSLLSYLNTKMFDFIEEFLRFIPRAPNIYMAHQAQINVVIECCIFIAQIFAVYKIISFFFYPKRESVWQDLTSAVEKKKTSIINIGENLVRIGFGVTNNIKIPLADDPVLSRYYNQLQKAELYAIRKKLGLKYYIKPTKQALATLGVYLNILLAKTYQKITKLLYKLPKIYAS